MVWTRSVVTLHRHKSVVVIMPVMGRMVRWVVLDSTAEAWRPWHGQGFPSELSSFLYLSPSWSQSPPQWIPGVMAGESVSRKPGFLLFLLITYKLWRLVTQASLSCSHRYTYSSLGLGVPRVLTRPLVVLSGSSAMSLNTPTRLSKLGPQLSR